MAMTYLTLRLERRGPAAWIWMNRPEVHNAFDEKLIADLTAAFATVDADRNVRAIVLAGEGKSFSAGADLNWMRRQGTAAFEDNVADARRLADLYRTIALCETPTVARVHGAALGGGMGLAAVCDICVASTQAQFATSEVRLGIIPAVIGPYVVRAIGERQSYRYSRPASESAHRVPTKSVSSTRPCRPRKWMRRSTRSLWRSSREVRAANRLRPT
jgi:methylglutaconyl-CoA hydratase